MTGRSSLFWTVYRTPVILALITGIGLLAGVLGDGVWDVVSWIGLGIPVAVILRFIARPQQRI